MKRLLSLLGLLVFASVPALASDFFFSNCDDGYISGPDYGNGDTTRALSKNAACDILGADGIHAINACDCDKDQGDCVITFSRGTARNPYCLQPGNGVQPGDIPFDSFAQFADTTSSFAASPGDNLIVCAGRCDGLGSAYYRVDPMSGGVFLAPMMNGTAGNPITIKPYCAGAQCETIIITGDTNGNGKHDTGEPSQFLKDSNEKVAYWTLDGDPLATGTQHIIFEKGNGDLFDLSNQASPASHDVIFNGLEIRNNVPLIWGNQNVNSACPASDAGAYVFHLDYMGAGPVKITNSKIHHVCRVIVRANHNALAGNDFLFDSNEVYNAGAVDDNNNFTEFTSSATQTFSNNYIHDAGGIYAGNNLQHVAIKNNTIACLGQYIVTDFIGCIAAIDVFDGDSPRCTSGCAIDDITISGNRVFGASNDLADFGMNTGIMVQGTYGYLGATAYPTGIFIEDNLVWWVHPHFTGLSWTSYDNVGRGGIVVWTPTSGVMVRNNTVYASTYPILIHGAGGTPTDYILDNLIYQSDRPDGSHNPELFIDNAVLTNSLVKNNNINYGTKSGNVIDLGNGTTYSCAQVTSTFNGLTADIANNICQPAAFLVDKTTAPLAFTTWNLHLSGYQASIDAGASCSTLDIDGQPRTYGQACDIGADEWVAGQAPHPVTPEIVLPTR